MGFAMKPALDAATIRARLQSGNATVITTDDWHYFAYEPITVGEDFIEFAMGPGLDVIKMPLDQIADVIVTSPL
jgi:hypothetical protein